ncbi:hypothetical protein D3C74_430240 [compost metagenome]
MEKILGLFLQGQRREVALMQPFPEGSGMDSNPDADICDREIIDHAQSCKDHIAVRGAGICSFHES